MQTDPIAYLIETLISMKHYYCNFDYQLEYLIRIKSSRLGRLARLDSDRLPAYNSSNGSYSSKYLSPEMLSLDYLRFNYMNIEPPVKEKISECLPLARRYEWSLKAAEDFCLMWIAVFYNLASSFALGIYGLILFEDYANEDLRKMSLYTEQMGCKIWKSTDEHGIDIIDLNSSSAPSRWTYLFKYLTVLTPGFFIVSVNFNLAVRSIEELNFIFEEQINNIRLCLCYAELLNDSNSKRATQQTSTGSELRSGCFYLDSVRDSIKLESSFPFRHLKPIDHQEAVQAIVQNHIDPETPLLSPFLDLITKIYLKNRSAKDMAKAASEPVSISILFFYVASFGSIILVTTINRMLNYYNLAPIVLAIAGFILTNSLMLTSTRVSFTTNRLIKSMWQMIAATGILRDLRVRHIRPQWIKQVLVLSREGTLKVTNFGIPVTYASLIEALIWTSTIASITYG